MADTHEEIPQNTPKADSAPRISAPAGLAVTAVIIMGFVLSYTTGYFTARKPPNNMGNKNPAPARIQVTPEATPMPRVAPADCTMLECLKSDSNGTYGYAMLTGYYRQYNGTQWEWNNAPATCDSIIPTGGSQTLIDDFVALIKKGNLLNKEIDGKLHININLADLTNAEKALLKQSSEDNPVELYVMRPVPPGRGASTCESYLTILKVSPKPELPEQ